MITTITREKKKRGFASLLNQFGEAGNKLTKLPPRAGPQTVSLIERLNLMIAAGVSFDVGTDDFQIMNADRLSDADKDFFVASRIYVLCTLQQGWLMKHLPLDLISEYKFEMGERLAIAADGREISSGAYFETVCQVTGKWFANLINEPQGEKL